jgi:hypothetical protein
MSIQTSLRQWSSSTLHKGHREVGEVAANRIDELEAKLKQLHKASERMRSDLLIRGETEANGTRVVNVSSSVWNAFCDALDEARL